MNQIQKLETWQKELALAETFEEIKLHDSAAAAAAEFARREKLSLEKQNEIGKFRISVETKKGEWLEENFKRGGRGMNEYSAKLQPEEVSKMPVNNHQSQRARKIKNTEEEKLEQIMHEIEERGEVITPNNVHKEIRKKEKKDQRIEEINKQLIEIETGNMPELEGLFDVISVDPPWNYEGEKKQVTSFDSVGRRVANPYPEMTTDEIKKIELPLKNDSIVFLWTTHKFLPKAFEILKEWNLEYKATLVWDKQKMGMGAWFRMQCEFCLVGIKGKPYFENTKYRDILTEARREHSRKPDSFFSMIEEITLGRRLEYFSREKRNGWEVFGNDINKF